MKLVRNERLKLTATFLNGLAIAVVAIGVFAPLIQALPTGRSAAGEVPAQLVICLLIAGALHLAARWILKGLLE